MRYLIIGALAPVLGAYPFLLFGSSYCHQPPLLFWLVAVLNELFRPGTPGHHGVLGSFLWCILARPGGKTQVV